MAALIRAGYVVALPFDGSLRYDMIIDDQGTLGRVQCKTATLKDGVVRFKTHSMTRSTGKTRSYHEEVEFFGAYCHENNTVYLVPVADAPNNVCYLRLDPPRNNQTKGLRWAKDYVI